MSVSLIATIKINIGNTLVEINIVKLIPKSYYYAYLQYEHDDVGHCFEP